MTRSRSRFAVAALAVAAAYVLLCAARALPGSPPGRLFTAHVMVASGAVVKLALLLSTAAWAFAVRDRLDRGHPARAPWGLMAAGFLALFAGQLTFAPSQLAHGTQPFPAPADLFFLTGTLLLFWAVVGFVRAYAASGLVADPHRGAALAALLAAAIAVGLLVVRGILRGPAPPLEKAISAAYPVLDLAILVPLGLLVRLTRRMGGAVGRVWHLLLAGFCAFTVGDVLFAFFSSAPEALVHASYVASYALCAAGARLQSALLGDAA